MHQFSKSLFEASSFPLSLSLAHTHTHPRLSRFLRTVPVQHGAKTSLASAWQTAGQSVNEQKESLDLSPGMRVSSPGPEPETLKIHDVTQAPDVISPLASGKSSSSSSLVMDEQPASLTHHRIRASRSKLGLPYLFTSIRAFVFLFFSARAVYLLLGS